MSGWKYSRKKLYKKLEKLLEEFKPDDHESWELFSQLKEFKGKIIERD